MSKHAKSTAKKHLGKLAKQQQREIDWDVVDLRSASYYFWLKDYTRASKLLFPLMNKLIVEPLKGTEEYKNGERKQEAQISEQEPEESRKIVEREIVTYEDLFSAGEIDPNAPTAERDEDGYLIR